MGKFDSILIVSDMDGTFLGKNARLVPENMEKIKYFTENGGHFTFASGRAGNSIGAGLSAAFELINEPAILANGSFFYDQKTKREFEGEFMEKSGVSEMISYIKENHPEIEFRFATPIGQVTDSIEGSCLKRENEMFGGFSVMPFSQMASIDWYKCVFCGDVDTLLKIRERFEGVYSDRYVMFDSEPGLLEVQNKGTSKASKMLKLKQKLAVEGNDVTVYACGDYENDYEMLLAADVAVCPTNALDKIKAICDISPCDNDEGLIASLIEIIERGL